MDGGDGTGRGSFAGEDPSEGFGVEDVGDLDAEERGMFAALVEGHYAEELYLEANPPTPAEYAREACRLFSGGSEELEGMESEIRERCELATFRVALGDRSYQHHREIYGAGAHRAALDRRRAAREAVGRWRRGDSDALTELMGITDEIRRAERPQDR